MLERTIEAYLVNECKARGCLCIKMGFYNGIPDRQVLLPTGESVFVELKQPDGRLSLVQKAVIKRLRGMNHLVFIAYNYEDVNDVLDVVDKKIIAWNEALRKKLVANWKPEGGDDCA